MCNLGSFASPLSSYSNSDVKQERVAFGMSASPIERSHLLSQFQDIRLAHIGE
jgi:hypothetical protein